MVWHSNDQRPGLLLKGEISPAGGGVGNIGIVQFSQRKTSSMQRIGFKMKLFKGFEEEYKKRHDKLWPDLEQLLKSAGISEYSIFLDEPAGVLFGFLKAEDPQALDNLPAHPVMQKWWAYMKDIMETNPDNSPVNIPLKEVFYLP
jgi:L-rhamnose mutarotase